MSTQQLQDYVFTTKYARYLPDLKRRETFEEAVHRVCNMHRTKFAGMGVDAEIDFAEAAMKDSLVLGSQRAMQFGGEPTLKKNARMYNCTTSYCDRVRFFQESFWLLLCGCGTGFSVQKHHIAKLPDIARPNADEYLFVIPDTIEGWADALGALMSSYFVSDQSHPEYAGHTVRFDYSLIRAKGTRLSSGSGKAPGPEPLKRSLEKIRALLDRCLNAGQTRLRPIDAYDAIMHASDAVLSGGVRRSATICIFSPDDHEMATAKTGDWHISNGQRGRSNNSAMLLRGQTPREQFDALMTAVRDCGEPGFVWADNTEIVYNPCVEIGLFPTISVEDLVELVPSQSYRSDLVPGTSISGWAFCNLCEINMKACDSVEKWRRACTAAAILGTLQAGYTSFEYLGPVSEAIARREALLGVSMTGMMDQPQLAFDPALQRGMAQLILDVNEKLAPRIGVRPTARATCVKPAGTTSCLLGTASGIHPHHSRRYIRHTRANTLETPYQHFAAVNPHAAEVSAYNPNGTDGVLAFCIETDAKAVTKDQVSALQLLDLVRRTKLNWVDHGCVKERCSAPFLAHNVSNTITVGPNEWDSVADFIWDNQQWFAGISLLPESGDLDYVQAPFASVWTRPEIETHYGQAGVHAIYERGLHKGTGFAHLWEACDAAMGMLPSDDNAERQTWIGQFRTISVAHFKGDGKRLAHALKRVHYLTRWESLMALGTRVDYTTMVEHHDDTKHEEVAACAGGKCDIV